MTSTGIAEELATIKLEKAVARILASDEADSDFHLVLPALMLTQSANDGRLSEAVREFLVKNVHNAAAQAYVEYVVTIHYLSASAGSKLAEELEAFLVEFNLAPIDDASPAQRTKLKSLIGSRLRSMRNNAPFTGELGGGDHESNVPDVASG